MRRFAADVDGIINRRHPLLHQVAGEAADDSADQHDQRHFVAVKANFLGQAFDGERAVGVDLLIPRLVRRFARIHQRREPNQTPP